MAWLCVRLLLTYTAITRDLLDGDLVSSLLLPAISNVNLGHLDADPEASRRHQGLDAAYPDELRRPANALSIAHSLGIPRETARAKLAGMVAAGVLQRTETGYILPASTVSSERFLPSVPLYLDALDDFVSGLGLIRAFGLRPGNRLAQPVWAVGWAAIRLGSAHVLRDAVCWRELTPGMSLTACHILLTVCQSVSGQLRLPPQILSQGRTPAAPGPTFGPVRGADVAERIGLPEETVRRHLKQLVATGYLSRGPGGYDVVHDVRTLPMWRMFQKRAQANARQLIWRLTTTGVVPATH